MRADLMRDGLPISLEAERSVLGSILNADDAFPQVTAVVQVDDFSIQKHRRIFRHMVDLNAAGQRIDRITLANSLMSAGQLEAVDGLGYLCELDSGLPRIANIEGYVRIVKEKSLLRRIIQKADLLTEQCLRGEDVASCVQAAETLGRSIAEENTMTVGSEPVEAQRIIESEYGNVMNPGSGGGIRIAMPWRGLPEWRAGQLIAIGARPGHGKSALLAQIAHHAAYCGTAVELYSLEMTRGSIIRRMASGVAGVDCEKWEMDALDDLERAAVVGPVEDIGKLPLRISDHPHATTASIRSALLRQRARGRAIGLVVVDYLQLVRPMGRPENRSVAVGEIARGLKQVAMEFQVPVATGSQLVRLQEREKREPNLSDLREGDIESHADQCWFIHPLQPETFFEEKRSRVSVLVRKNRSGRCGKKVLLFEKPFTRFGEEV